MAGLSNAREAALLDSTFSGTLRLRLLQWTGASGQGAGVTVNDDGTLPAGLQEISGSGYPSGGLSVPGSSWNSAVAGAPTIKTCPTVAASPLTFTPSGGTWTDIASYAWTSDTNSITSANFVSSGVFVDDNDDPHVFTLGDGEPLQITSSNPITERLGDPPSGVNPT